MPEDRTVLEHRYVLEKHAPGYITVCISSYLAVGSHTFNLKHAEPLMRACGTATGWAFAADTALLTTSRT